MKKFFILILSLAITFSNVIVVNAEEEDFKTQLMSAFDYISTDGAIWGSSSTIMQKSNDPLDGDYISVIQPNTGKYAAFDEILLESNITVNGSDNFSMAAPSCTSLNFQTAIDMTKLAVAYSDYCTLLDNLVTTLNTDTESCNNIKFKGEFAINIAIPSGCSFTDDTFITDTLAGLSFSDGTPASDVFTEVSRTFTDNVLTIVIALNKSRSELDSFFNGTNTPNLVLDYTLYTPSVTYTYTFVISERMSGYVDVYTDSGSKIGEIECIAIQSSSLNESDSVSGDDIILSETTTLCVPSIGGGGGGSSSIEGDNVVQVETVKGNAGETVCVDVMLNNGTGITSMGIEVDYDNSIMTLTDVQTSDAVGATVTTAMDLSVKPYHILFDSTQNFTYSGSLATLTFEIAADAPTGEYPITIDYYKGADSSYVDGDDINYDENFDPVTLTYVPGALKIYMPGDLNDDKKINNKDATYLLRYLADWDIPDIVTVALDVNGDDCIDENDATHLLRYIARWSNIVLY